MTPYYQFVPHEPGFPYAFLDEVARKVSGDEIIVEVGAFLGHGTCYLCEQLALLDKRPRFFAIDPWDQVLEKVWGEMRTELLPWGETIPEWRARGGSSYDTFRYHLSQCPAGDRLYDHAQFPCACSAGEFRDDSITAVFLHYSRTDAGIDEEIKMWWPKVRSGGLMGIYNPEWDGLKIRTMLKG